VVTVHHEYYEKALDWNLMELVSDGLRIERVAALPTEPIRVVGDISIRGFFPLLSRVLQLTNNEEIDFLYLPIPPHYTALLGPIVHLLQKIPYGIDYIDPWVQPRWHPEEQLFNRHWFARQLAHMLEPVAVRSASLITGVAQGYYEDVLERNPHLQEQAVTAAMPYGGEKSDHRAAAASDAVPYLFENDTEAFRFVYAGALLPKAREPLDRMCQSIAEHRRLFDNVRLHFIGTGKSPDDPDGYKVRPIAEQYDLWESTIFEHPPRIPYLDALVHQQSADAILILGSTEPHYTPSKVYQGVLSGKPILAVLHEASTACQVVRDTGTGQVLSFDGASDVDKVEESFADEMNSFLRFAESFDSSQVDESAFRQYSARSTTQKLVKALDRAAFDQLD
jgi:hypothetical protein